MNEHPAAPESHWSTLEVAHQLGMAVRSVQLMVDRGELDAWKTPGGHRRISRLSVELWMAQRRTGAAPPAPMPTMAPSSPFLSSGASAGLSAPGMPYLVTAPPSDAEMQRRADAPPDRGCVLVIEDSKHYQNLVALLLREHFPQLDVKFADDGIAGLAMVGQLRPRVLIIDILLPGIDGATLIMSLRSHPQFANSVLLVLTSLDDADLAPYRFALDNVTVLNKADVVAELPHQLRRLLDAAPPWIGNTLARRHGDR